MALKNLEKYNAAREPTGPPPMIATESLVEDMLADGGMVMVKRLKDQRRDLIGW